jgi:hypothetical protein
VNKRLPLILAGTLALYHLLLVFTGGGGHPHALYFLDFPVFFALNWLRLNSLAYIVAYGATSTLMWAVPGWVIGTMLKQQNLASISLTRLAAQTSAVIPFVCLSVVIVASRDIGEVTNFALSPLGVILGLVAACLGARRGYRGVLTPAICGVSLNFLILLFLFWQ